MGDTPRLTVSVAYIVISHRNPPQVLRLVRALKEDSEAVVLVRHDQRASTLPDAEIEAAGGEAVSGEVEPGWGDWRHLRSILHCLHEAATRHDPPWTLIVSGQDYPVRAPREIASELRDASEDARLGSIREVEPGSAPDDEFHLRCLYRHYDRPRGMPGLPLVMRPLVYTRDLPSLVGFRRLRPWPLRPYVSADWLTLGRRALGAVLDAADDPRLMRHFRRVAVPSESFFASVLLNRPDLVVDGDNRRFVRFARLGAAHPDTLTSVDLDRVLASGADFARKFDITVDAEVLDRLDEHRHAEIAR